jgi:phage gpG-like protein
MALTVTVNDREVTLRLNELARAITPRSVLNIANRVMQGSIDETFAQEGFPARSWRVLHAGTIKVEFERRNRGKKISLKSGRQSKGFLRHAFGKRILTNTGDLRQSIRGEVRGNRLVIGTNLIYARVHQEGAVITADAGTRFGITAAQAKLILTGRVSSGVRGRKYLRFPIGEGQFAFARQVVVPARPFLVIKPGDPGKIVEAVEGAIKQE